MTIPSIPPPVRAFVFDLGGVLIDWNPRYLYRQLLDDDTAIQEFFDEVGFGEWNLRQDRGRAFAEAVDDLAGRYPHRADLIRAYPERYPETVGGPIQGTVEILRALHDKGYPLYALSNWSAETFAMVRDDFPFLALFDSIVLSGEVRLVKPEPEIFHLTLQRIGLPAQECLFIDDSAANIAAARALGWQAIRFESPEQLARELRQAGVDLSLL